MKNLIFSLTITMFFVANTFAQKDFTCGDPFTDSRNGQTYNTVQIDEQCWMAENLNIGSIIQNLDEMTDNGVIEKYCYNNEPSKCNQYGGLYQWNEVMQYTTTSGVQGICPEGWYIPTDDEWKILEGIADSQYSVGDPIWNTSGYRGFDAGLNLKSTSDWFSGNNGTNLYGFNALPGGNRNHYANFENLNKYFGFWTSNNYSNETAWARGSYYTLDNMRREQDNKNFAYAIRCMKDETTPVNLPPEPPSSPNPQNGAVNQSVEIDLSWTCTDPEGDPLTYDVYFGTETTPSLVISGQTETTYDPGTLENNTEYYWKIVAHDDHSNTTEGSVWSFTTIENFPPEPPSSPNPQNGAVNQSIEVDLSWTCIDPEGDPLTYDIYLGTEITPTLVFSGQTETTYDPGTLVNNTEYFWKIVAHDDNNNTTEGPVWSFITEDGGGQWQCGDPFTDSRDGQTYNSVQIGEQCWMAENLNIGGMINGSEEMTDNSVIEKYCYDNSTANCETYGGLYQWNEMMEYSTTPGVQGICPSGWHLPTDDEWKILEGTVDSQYPVGDTIWNQTGYRGYDAGLNLKSISGWYAGGNGSGLYNYEALPGAYRHPGGGFYSLATNASFWSSSESNSSNAWDRLLGYSNSSMTRNDNDKSYGFSVRCLQAGTTPINQPPEPPSSPNPEDGAINQSVEIDLSWTCIDPEGDPLTYDVYFGIEATPPQITTGQTETTYNPGILVNNTEYFWKIIAHDDHSNTTEGSVWSFTTKDEILLGADFEAEPLSGNAPLIVQFTDLSTDNTSSWQWDFDNNGTIDSEEQNPEWTYNEPGFYSVSLTVSDGTNEDTETKEDYIEVTEPSTGVEPTGSGTEADPWQIATLDNLLWVSINSSSWSNVNYFIQIANIDATDTENWNGGEGFSPIGNNPTSFQGNYDGQNYSINGLYINRPTAYDQGLFGYSAGLIENVNLTNVNITGFDGVGALVGVSYVTTVSHCTSSGYVTGTENRIGGLAGESYGGWTQGYVTDCHSSCHVTGVDNVGGLVGQSSRSTISYCSDSGSVSGSEKVGGLVGYSVSPSSITNSFSTGSVSGSNYIGGLAGNCNTTAVGNCYSRSSVNGVSHVAGLVGYAGETNIWDCYSTGIVVGTGSYVGGLVGEIYWFASVDNSFWDYEASGIMSSPYGGTGKTTAEMQDVATFTNEATTGLSYAWDFVGNPNGDTGNDDYWDIDGFNNDGYPYLSYQYSSPLQADFSASNTTISLGDNIHFTDLSTGSPTTWEWDFQNDGTIDSYDQNPNWIYAVSGIYTVSLRVSDGIYYNFSNKNDYIIVVDCNPTMAFSPNPLDFGINEIAPVQDTLSSWLKNTSNCQLYINSLFGLQPPLSYDTTGLSSASIMPGDSLEIQVILNKDFAAGTYTDTLIVSNSTSQNIDLEDRLVAWYPFNGNANDESGNGHNGQISGDPQSVNDRFGNNNSAYDFDGNGDFITAGNWFTYQDFTISVWVKQDGLNSNYVDIIDNNHGYDNWAIQYNYDIDTYVFYVAPLGATAFTLPNSQWKHLVFIKDGLSLKTYINGILQDELTATTPTINYSNPYLNIARWGGGSRYFNGKIDDIRMYDRGLTEDEVEALYNENNGIEGYPQLIVQAELEYPVLIADFEADNVSVNLGEEIQFTDLSSGNPTSWQWDFNNDGSIDSEEQNPEWIYNEPGIYSVSLTISDGTNEDTETKEDYITVLAPMQADFSADPVLGIAPLIVLFSDLSTGNPTTWQWDFNNDGTIDSEEQNPEWIYYEPGIYTVSLTVTDENELSDTETKVDYINVSSQGEEQLIELPSGYSFVSTRIIPENPDFAVICDGILLNLDFARNTAGSMLRKIGPMWINGIGDWVTTEGYLFRMNNPDEMTISGNVIDPQTPILLSEGYQFISYLPENSIDALEVFDDVLGNLDFVRNSAGSMLRKIGPMWINSIGEMNPSEGYLVKMINPDELIYPGSANSCGEPFIDSRDGKTYNTVLIGEQCWMAENLNIGEMINGTEEMTNNGVIERYCQENNSANCDEYGGLYQWNEMMQYTTTQGVQGICPDNWHLPTDGEWTTVTNFLGGIDVAGGKMKEIGTAHWRSPNTGATNESGFTALPGGSRQTTGSMGYMGDDGCFWSSTEFNASAGNYRLLRYNFNNVGCYSFIKNKGYSVRCLQDNSKSGKSFSVNKNINPVNFNFEGGNAADPVYTIYIDGLQIGDEVAAFDEGKMIGSIVINSNNVFENDLAVFNIINSGQGYQAGNPIQLKIWNSFTQETSIAEYEMSDPYNEAYMQDVYPNEDGLYSVIKITKDVNNFANSSVNISIFPNPSEGVFNISVKGVSGKVQMKVIDVHGNDYRLLEIDGTNSIITEKLDLKELPAGVYFISFSCKDFSQVKKIVIQ